MKSAITFCLLVVLVLSGTRRTAEAAQVYGMPYVWLADWAKANGFEVRWLKPDETLQLSKNGSKLVLTVDSRETQINGVQVWLLLPVVARNGKVCLAQLDVERTLQPLLWPTRAQASARIRKICLDPGHGGKDPGNQVGSNQEKQYTLLLAQEVRTQLAQAGFKVTLTRSTDTFIDLPTRSELAKRQSADLLVSLHLNAAETGRDSVQGAEVYCLTPAGASSTNARKEGSFAGWFPGNRHNDLNLFLAYQVQKALTRNLAVPDRGVRRARFAVLRNAVMPAVLVEAGFMSHPKEGRKIFTAAYRQKMARAIVEGLLAYKRAVERGV
jgi:N-acetylmuramoyl-L-alanine amidase